MFINFPILLSNIFLYKICRQLYLYNIMRHNLHNKSWTFFLFCLKFAPNMLKIEQWTINYMKSKEREERNNMFCFLFDTVGIAVMSGIGHVQCLIRSQPLVHCHIVVLIQPTYEGTRIFISFLLRLYLFWFAWNPTMLQFLSGNTPALESILSQASSSLTTGLVNTNP